MNSFLETLKKLGPTRLAVMGAVILGLLMFFVFISMKVSTPSLKLLYSDLSTVDSSAVAAKLESEEIRYEVSADGSRVMVPANEIGRARMLLAEAGLPDGGSMGYELFDSQSGFGTTNFVQNINQVRALEGELSRTIGTLEPIRSARVHIVLPQRELFSRDTTDARASVVVNLVQGQRLERQQIMAIQSLVSSAVPDLEPTNISVVDQSGTLLARGEDNIEELYGTKTAEMRQNIENRMRQNIEEIVGQIVGFGKVRATISADLNFDRITTNEELYDPETVVRSTQTTEENNLEREPKAEEVGVENNLPGADAALLTGKEPTLESNKIEEVTNYEISKTVRNMVREIGEIRKLSVAVLVDGTYTTTTNEEGEEVRTYQPRTQAELDQIKALVRSSVGINDERGDLIDVVNMQFAELPQEDLFEGDKILGFETSELKDLIEVIIITIAILLVVLLVLRPMVSRVLEIQDVKEDDDIEAELLAATAMTPALTGPSSSHVRSILEDDSEGGEENLIDMNQVEGKVKASSLKKVEDIVGAYPNETVSVLRSWMSQES